MNGKLTSVFYAVATGLLSIPVLFVQSASGAPVEDPAPPTISRADELYLASRTAANTTNTTTTTTTTTTNTTSPVVQSTVTTLSTSQTIQLISNAAVGGFIPSGGGGGFVPSGGGGGFAPSGSQGGGFAPSGDQRSQLAPFSTRGMSAGDAPSRHAVWGQGTYTLLDRSETNLEMDGEAGALVIGGDIRFDAKLLGGVALSWEESNFNTVYNKGTHKGSGVSIAPYLGVKLNDDLTADFSVGYGWMDYETTRNSGANTGSYEGQRFFTSANLVGLHAIDNWKFQPRVGLFYANEKQEAYQESGGGGVYTPMDHVEVGRMTAGSKIGYALENAIPYVKVLGEWDFITPNSVLKSGGQYSTVDRGGGVLGLGYEIYNAGFIGSLELNDNAVFRQDLDLWSLTLRGRYEF